MDEMQTTEGSPLVFASDHSSRPVLAVKKRGNFHPKVLGQRLTHDVNLHRGYRALSDCVAYMVVSSQEAEAAHCG